MRALALLVVAGCYAPDLAPCAVHCDDTVPCPNELVCAVDRHCHPAGDTTTCPNDVIIAVKKTGDGGGRVASPDGIDCGTTCSVTLSPGTNIALRATANTGSRFVVWTGACSGTDTCAISATSDQTATARFNLASNLTVIFAGGGGGRVTSSPSALDCTADCTVAFDTGTFVTLVATPDASSTFGGWDGACIADPCEPPLDADATVTAYFQ
ncbi:MAG: hypothetical protein ABJE66_11495 [Deltaproteobacteria bacterium]